MSKTTDIGNESIEMMLFQKIDVAMTKYCPYIFVAFVLYLASHLIVAGF